MSKLRPLLIYGTRPEAIKMAPIVQECQRRTDCIHPIICITGQHREMLAQVNDYFGIKADFDLDLMQPNQSLAELTARCIMRLDEVFKDQTPDCVVAQGDTTTVLAAAMTSFYHRIPFVHVEAGLRTGDIYSPWPEEMNRRFASIVTRLHCAPTTRAAEALRREGIPETQISVTGNTVIDALIQTRDRESQNTRWEQTFPFIGDSPMVLITGHRRENFGAGFENICHSIHDLSHQFQNHQFVYPVHLNPNVQEPVNRLLGKLDNVHLVAPASYPQFVWLMNRSQLILTDSGGVQEEAPSLGKPVVVMRDTTERPEAVESGAACLVGTCRKKIVDTVSELLSNSNVYRQAQVDRNPYGDGKAASKIVDWMIAELSGT
jgi:UDP-N-acetylglucosamine 2-epimerase (non-hydrolysing)